MIPYSTQSINESDIRAVARALRSRALTQGPEVIAFEKAVARYCGARYAVAFASGTAALHGAYAAAGIGKDDEILTSPLTFAATANAALYLGARPVFADIDATTGSIDPNVVAKKINKRTKAIVAVDYAGLPADLASLKRLARKHKIAFIEDAAQSLGASYRGTKVGSLADMTMFSFHPVKSITTGEGGIITTNNRRYYKQLLLFRHHGIAKGEQVRAKGKPAWYQEMQILGYNYRLTDIQAALGRSQMSRLNSFIKKRRTLAARYERALRKHPELILPIEPKDRSSAWHIYPIRLSPELAKKRDALFAKLRVDGIGVQAHHVPVYLHPYYRALGYKKGASPVTEAYFNAELSLPLFPDLTKKQQDFVIQRLAYHLKSL